MVNITDPTITGHINLVVRPTSDRILGLVALLMSEKSRFRDVIEPMMVDNADEDEIMDGAHEDHRTVMTKRDLVMFWQHMDAIIAMSEAPGIYDDIAKAHVNIIGL